MYSFYETIIKDINQLLNMVTFFEVISATAKDDNNGEIKQKMHFLASSFKKSGTLWTVDLHKNYRESLRHAEEKSVTSPEDESLAQEIKNLLDEITSALNPIPDPILFNKKSEIAESIGNIRQHLDLYFLKKDNIMKSLEADPTKTQALMASILDAMES